MVELLDSECFVDLKLAVAAVLLGLRRFHGRLLLTGGSFWACPGWLTASF